MSGVVNTCLNAVTEVNTKLRGLAQHSFVHGGVLLELISQKVVVLREIGKLGGHSFGEEGGSLLGTIVFFVTTSELNPLRKGLDVGGETSWGIVSGQCGGTLLSSDRLSTFLLLLNLRSSLLIVVLLVREIGLRDLLLNGTILFSLNASVEISID